MLNIVGLTSITNPYTQARWSAFSKENPNYNVFLIEFGRVSKVYDWKPVELEVPYTRLVLSEKPSQNQTVRELLSLIRALFKALEKTKPDVIVLNGYQQPATLAALLWSKLHGKRAVLLSESKEDDAPRKRLVEAVKKLLVSFYQSALVGGKRHQDYLASLNMAHGSIFLGYNVVENNEYHPTKLAYLPYPTATEKPYFLVISRFVIKKNIPTIIDAYSEYHRRHTSEAWDLILCGDGILRPQIEAQVSKLNLSQNIHLTGFLQPNELLPFLAHAGCFIHASTQEQWGLVVNEAMAAGLPVIVSSCCGCFDELIIEGVNGFGFDASQPSELADLMKKVSILQVDLAKMRQASLDHIRQFGPSYFAEGLYKAVQYAINQ